MNSQYKMQFYQVSVDMELATIEQLKLQIQCGEILPEGQFSRAYERLGKYLVKLRKYTNAYELEFPALSSRNRSLPVPTPTLQTSNHHPVSAKSEWTSSTPWSEDEGDDITDLPPIMWNDDKADEESYNKSEVSGVEDNSDVIDSHIHKPFIPKRHSCGKCGKTFDNAINLRYHQQRHRDELRCDRCKRRFSRGFHLRRHQMRGCQRPTSVDIQCDECGKTFSQMQKLIHHQEQRVCSKSKTTRDEMVKCDDCNHMFCSDYVLQKHIERGVCGKVRNPPPVYRGKVNNQFFSTLSCSSCAKIFKTQHELDLHDLTHTTHKDNFDNHSAQIRLSKHSINRSIREYQLTDTETIYDAVHWLSKNKILIEQTFNHLNKFLLKAQLVVNLKFDKYDHLTGTLVKSFNFYIYSGRADIVEDFDVWFDRHLLSLKEKIENNEENDSGLELICICDFALKVCLLENHCGRGEFALPKELSGLQALVNVHTPSQCFKYATLSVLHYNDIKRNRQRVSKYTEYENELNFGDLNPNSIEIKDIPLFERLNKIKVNVHVWDKGLKGARYNSRCCTYDRTVNLLLIYNEKDMSSHYVGITNISRLYKQTTSYNAKFYYCDRCLRRFTIKQYFEKHYEWCRKGKLQIEHMPKKIEYTYRDNGAELSPACVVYADIECYIDNEKNHKAAAIACYEKWHDQLNSKSNMHVWEGDDCIVNFLSFLDELVKYKHKNAEELTRQPMSMTRNDYDIFNSTTHCSKCKTKFDSNSSKKVRDHDHITGRFRNALCSKCNFSHRLKRNILPVIFHNFKSYDAHIIVKEGLGEMIDWKLDVIAQTKEKFMSLTAKVPVGETKDGQTLHSNIKFMDSFQFMSSSLANLVNNLTSLPITSTLQQQYSNVDQQLLKRKGVFPYSYFDSLERLKETSLPSIDKFKNDLSNEVCSQEDYAHAQLAWEKFDCKTFGDYMLAYLKLDVYLLADVFEAFRKVAMDEDQLDPVHFISLPSMTYMSAFKMTGETIHLLNDLEQYSLFERGIRGGLTFVNKHKIKHKTTRSSITHLKYIDQNNLYGSSLSKPLPHSNFRWLTDEEVEFFNNPHNILAIDSDGDTGYLFEVDLKYPDEIKDETVDYPLAPESGYVTEDMFSPFMSEYYNEIDGGKYKPTRKLLLNQFDKEDYIVHFAILKFYLEMGMQLMKIHRGIQFTQKPFLKMYIDYNSSKRQNAKNSFEKDYYKLKNNALFGKTMEDVRKRINYKLINDVEAKDKLCASPFYYSCDVISENISGIKMTKPDVTLDKPIYIGQAVLDYSKLEMYTLYYKTLKSCAKIKKLELVGGDTDSFFLSITIPKDECIDNVFKSLRPYFDSSNFPSTHHLYSIENKAKLGCFKDECAGKEIEEMILLRPKMYSMKPKTSQNSIKRAKGISKSIVKRLTHQQYKKIFKNMSTLKASMTIIKSVLQQVRTHTFDKKALSAWEDKRCWISKNFSLPHGHPDTHIPPPKKRKLVIPPCGDVN